MFSLHQLSTNIRFIFNQLFLLLNVSQGQVLISLLSFAGLNVHQLLFRHSLLWFGQIPQMVKKFPEGPPYMR